MAMNLEAMKKPKRFFETRGKQVFDLLESAINYAALCHPDEFFERRDQIAQLLFARQQQHPRGVNIHDNDVSEEEEEEDTRTNSSNFSNTALLRMKEHRAEGCVFSSKKSTRESKPDGTEIVISNSEKCSASGNIGMGTEEDAKPKRRHIIRIKLRPPKPNKEEQFLALEEAESKVAMEEPETTGKFSEKSSERKTIEKNRVMIKEQKSMCSDFEVKLEASKRKLQEGYKQFESTKQKKKIRMIELKDLPGGGVGCRPVNHVRSNKGRLMNYISSSCTR